MSSEEEIEKSPDKIDLIEIFTSYPCKIPNTMRMIIDKLIEIYGESLQPCITDVYYKCIEQKDPYVLQFIFFTLLNEEDYVVNMVKDKMPPEKLERLELFFEFLDIKYKQLLSVHPTSENIQELIRCYTDSCANVWSSNRQVYMRKIIDENTDHL